MKLLAFSRQLSAFGGQLNGPNVRKCTFRKPWLVSDPSKGKRYFLQIIKLMAES